MRIFSLEELARRRIPSPDDFRAALEEYEDICVKPYLGERVVGGFLYGSSVNGDLAPSSDIDYFLLVDGSEHLRLVKDARQAVMEKHGVEVECRVIDCRDAIKAEHDIIPSFMIHLENSVRENGFRGENPLGLVKPLPVSLESSLHDSFIHYRNKLTKAFVNGYDHGPSHAKLQKTVLSVPFNAVRGLVMLDHLVYRGLPSTDLPSTKRDLIGACEEHHPQSRLGQEARSLLRVREWYDRGLSLVRDGGIVGEDLVHFYNAMSSLIDGSYGRALRVVEGVCAEAREGKG